jgi:4-hydroxy-tetrahydrodipicolinate reductase
MNLVIYGAAGKMGQSIINLAKKDDNFKIVTALEHEGNRAINTGEPIIYSIKDLDRFLIEADVIIDFTNPESSLSNLLYADRYSVPIVIGTTGFNIEQKQKIKAISERIPVLLSPNMSIGVNILFKLVKEVAEKMIDFDVEILELHHNKKKDAPSGTASKLAEIVASARGKNIEDVAVYERHGITSSRTKEEIGVFSIRAGDIVGDHTVYFAGQGERIELTHRASSRDTFAAGALKAAKWIGKQKPGLYDMTDVLK